MTAFDVRGEVLPLTFLEAVLRKVFAHPRQSLYKEALEAKG